MSKCYIGAHVACRRDRARRKGMLSVAGTDLPNRSGLVKASLDHPDMPAPGMEQVTTGQPYTLASQSYVGWMWDGWFDNEQGLGTELKTIVPPPGNTDLWGKWHQGAGPIPSDKIRIQYRWSDSPQPFVPSDKIRMQYRWA